MNVVGFAACWLPASDGCVSLSINQAASTQAVLGPAVGLVGNTTHASIHGQVPLNIDTCCGIPTDARLHGRAGTTMAESRDEARQRSASGHTIHRNTGSPRTQCGARTTLLLLDGRDIRTLTLGQKPKPSTAMVEGATFLHSSHQNEALATEAPSLAASPGELFTKSEGFFKKFQKSTNAICFH